MERELKKKFLEKYSKLYSCVILQETVMWSKVNLFLRRKYDESFLPHKSYGVLITVNWIYCKVEKKVSCNNFGKNIYSYIKYELNSDKHACRLSDCKKYVS